MLGVGIDGAERFHLVAPGRGEDGVFKVSVVEHTPTAVTAPMSRIVGLQPESLPQARTGQCAAPAGTRPASADRRRGRTTVTTTNEGRQSRSEEGPPPIAHNG